MRWLLVPLALLLLCPATRAADPPEHTVQCRIERGRLVAPVRLNGRGPYDFLVDAGLQAPVISPRTALDIGAATSGTAELQSLVLAEGLTHSASAAVVDLAEVQARVGTSIEGILPLYQAGLEVTLDLASVRLQYRPLGAALLGAKSGATVALKLRDGVVPRLPVLIEGKHQREVTLDLSFPDALGLTEPTLRDLGLIDRDMRAIRTFNAEGAALAQFRVRALQLGTLDLQAPLCAMVGDQDRIGLAALRHARLTLNFEAGLARWDAAGPPRVQAPPLVGYGLVLDQIEGGQWRLGVMEDSPAARAGIQPGALLAGINNMALRNTTYAAAGRLLRAEVPGDLIDITVIQLGAPLSATLEAETLL